MEEVRISEVKRNQEEDRESSGMESVAVVPLALPLMAGPGAISSVIVFAAEHNKMVNFVGMFLTIVTIGLVSWALFRMAPVLFKLLGKTGINVITRLMGLLMLSLGIEVIAAGAKGLFPTLIG